MLAARSASSSARPLPQRARAPHPSHPPRARAEFSTELGGAATSSRNRLYTTASQARVRTPATLHALSVPAARARRLALSRLACSLAARRSRAACVLLRGAHSAHPVRISQDRPRAGRSCGSRPSRPSAPLRTELAEAIVTELREPQAACAKPRARGTGGRAGERTAGARACGGQQPPAARKLGALSSASALASRPRRAAPAARTLSAARSRPHCSRSHRSRPRRSRPHRSRPHRLHASVRYLCACSLVASCRVHGFCVHLLCAISITQFIPISQNLVLSRLNFDPLQACNGIQSLQGSDPCNHPCNDPCNHYKTTSLLQALLQALLQGCLL